jgi:hypothetical protein
MVDNFVDGGQGLADVDHHLSSELLSWCMNSTA